MNWSSKDNCYNALSALADDYYKIKHIRFQRNFSNLEFDYLLGDVAGYFLTPSLHRKLPFSDEFTSLHRSSGSVN